MVLFFFLFVLITYSFVLWENQVYGIEPAENAFLNGGPLGQSSFFPIRSSCAIIFVGELSRDSVGSFLKMHLIVNMKH